MKTPLLITVVCLCLLSSCKKDAATSNTCAKTVANIAGTYSPVKNEISMMNAPFMDITSQWQACERDDKVTLNANLTYAYQDLGTSCTPSGKSMGTWRISADGKFTINDNGSAENITNADITSFDCSTLVLTGDVSAGTGTRFRLTLKK